MPEQLSAVASDGANWLTNVAYIVVAAITAIGGIFCRPSYEQGQGSRSGSGHSRPRGP
jgi:hypothetical protein